MSLYNVRNENHVLRKVNSQFYHCISNLKASMYIEKNSP